MSSTLSSISPTDSGLAHLRFLHGGLLSFRQRHHYLTTPAQPTSAHSSPPQSRSRNPSRGAPIHSGRRVVSYRTRPTLATLLLFSFNGDNSPFICTISEAVVPIRSQFSESNSTSSPPPMRTKKLNLLHHKEGGGESP